MRTPLIASFLLVFLFTACAAPTAVPPTATLTPMPPTATLEPSPTATQPAPTEGVGTATPTLPPTPESLLPLDFTVANWQEFRTKILPYCYVRTDLSSNKEGLDKVWAELQGTETYDILKGRLDRGEIFTFGSAVAPGDEGGCAMIPIFSDMSTISGALFQSRLDPNKYIEVEFTSPTAN